MATSPTKPSTPRLSETARHVVFPSSIVTTAWPHVVAECADWGVRFDGWQDGVGRVALGKRKDGKWASTVGGVVLSIPRQVGKTFLVGCIVVALCILHPGLKVVWTAHRTRTATNTFQTLQSICRKKKVAPKVAAVRTANGEQEIRFRNGSVILFGAREQGFGRGFDELDIEVFDEAQILTEKALEDMVPAANQSRHPSGALLFFMGTPPRPVDPGEEFSNRRAKALSGKSDGMVYVEFSADEGAEPDDREQWGKANPSFPSRTPVESMERMREQLTDDESFMREALGIWDAQSDNSVIDAEAWRLVADEASVAVDDIALAVDISPDRKSASVALAGRRADGSWHVELDEHRRGTAWIAGWIEDRCSRADVRAVVVDAMSPAASLVDELAQRRIKVTTTSARDMAVACGNFFDGVMDARVRHIDQPPLSYALSVARKLDLQGAWGWNRKDSTSDITPIVAATLALWGAQNSNVKRPARKRSGGRRVVMP